MNEFDGTFPDTPQVQLHNLLFEQGIDNALFRQLDTGEQTDETEIEVDVGAARLAVHRTRVEAIQEELRTIVEQFPRLDPDRLSTFGEGPSYLEVGTIVGDQRTALTLFGIGEALGWWQVMTPKKILGKLIDDQLAGEMMNMGYITIERKTE